VKIFVKKMYLYRTISNPSTDILIFSRERRYLLFQEHKWDRKMSFLLIASYISLARPYFSSVMNFLN